MCASNVVPTYDLPDEGWVRERYHVTLLMDDGRLVTYAVNAIGPFNAQQLAIEEARDVDLIVEEVREVVAQFESRSVSERTRATGGACIEP